MSVYDVKRGTTKKFLRNYNDAYLRPMNEGRSEESMRQQTQFRNCIVCVATAEICHSRSILNLRAFLTTWNRILLEKLIVV